MEDHITIKDIGMIISNVLPKTKFKIKAEVQQPKITNGNMYLKIKDKDGALSSMIWKKSMNETTKNIKNGDMVDVEGKLGFYVPTGSLNMIISDLSPCNNIGDKMKQYEIMKKEYEMKGYFDNKLKLPPIISNILILSSMNGAAIQDFYYVLDNNKSKVKRTLIDVVVQGNDCPHMIANILETTDLDSYDLIVITRGGGSMDDLWCFNHKDIVESVYKCKKPILSAIGHMIDTTLIDLVADISTPTPSLASQYIVDHNANYLEKQKNILLKIHKKLVGYVNTNINDINMIVSNKKNEIKNKFNIMLSNIRSIIISDIMDKIKKYDDIILKYTMCERNNMIYILNKNNVEIDNIKFKKLLDKNQPFTIIWNKVKVTISDYMTTTSYETSRS